MEAAGAIKVNLPVKRWPSPPPRTLRASRGGMRYERRDSLAKTAKVGDQNFRDANF
jgi:hypothetical protein